MAGLPAKVRKFVQLHRHRKKLEAELERNKETAEKLEAELCEEFAAAGIQNISIDGATVFLARQIWASPAAGQGEALARAMRTIGMGDLVKETVNANQLSAFVRELPRDTDDMPILPAALAGLVCVRDVVSVRVNERS